MATAERIIPLPSVPVVDIRSGLMDPTWYDYFLRNAQLFQTLQTDLTALQATVAALDAAVDALAPQLAKAWASVSISGVVTTLEQGFNVTSVTFISTGRYSIVLTTPFANDDWVPEAICCTFGAVDLYSGVRNITSSSVELIFTDASFNRTDPVTFYFAGFGNQ